MAERYDLLLKGGRVVDPATGRDEVADVGIVAGKIAAISPDISPAKAQEVVDAAGKVVMPGIIDLHVHASAWLGGRFGHKMLAQAGVTTALDMAGPMGSVLDIAAEYGTGLNIASIQYVRPEHTVKTEDPGEAELRTLVNRCLAEGALGVKLLGGHYPITPEATARAIEVANELGAYVAFHAGTKKYGSNIEGFLEAVELAGGRALHIAHINSYCRGLVRPYMEETEEAVAALTANPNIVCESYLSPLNGTSAKCADGVPESLTTRNGGLKVGGFPPTEAGMEAAILAGWAQINMEAAGKVVLATGREAVDYWRSRGTDTTVSFLVNPPEPRLRLAAAKRPSGGFVVDAISTDGGGIPRNVILEMGLSLVKLQALTMQEFVLKTSANPAAILGLAGKGHFRPGADADVTVVDLGAQRAYMTIVDGRIVMCDGQVFGKGGAIVTTAAGEAGVRARGLKAIVVNLAASAFYRGRQA